MTDESDINNVINGADNFMGNPSLNSPRSNIIKLVIINETNYGMVRERIDIPSGKILSCTTGNGYVAPNSVVSYFIKNTFSENIYCIIVYEDFSVAESFDIIIQGNLSNTPPDQYVVIDRGPNGPSITVTYMGYSSGVKTYLLYNVNPRE